MSTPCSAPPIESSPAPAQSVTNIDSMLKEKRIFKPAAKFAKTARIGSLK